MKEKFINLYKKAFDTEGNIKNCGRDICKQLIATAVELDGKTKYGDLKTGFMNTDNIKKLYSDLNC